MSDKMEKWLQTVDGSETERWQKAAPEERAQWLQWLNRKGGSKQDREKARRLRKIAQA